MPMYKAATQPVLEEVIVTLPIQQAEEDNEIVLYKDLPSDEEVVEMHAPDGEHAHEISFKLPFLPGAPDELLEIGDALETVDEDKKDEKETDKSKAADQPKDLNWVKDFLNKIPKHKGETLGLERADSYLAKGIGSLSKMIQEDHEGKIDISKAEEALVEMENGRDRLKKELQRRKKKADKDSGMTKEAQKIAGVGGIIVTVPLKISRIARVCINATISGGKNIEDMVKKQSEKWKLDENDQADLIQLIQDMGYYVRRDRGFMVDDKEPYQYSSENNFDYPPNYQA